MPADHSYRASHRSGTATTTPFKVTTTGTKRGFRLVLRNTDATNDVEVSFDSGRNFFPLPQGEVPLHLDIAFHFFFVRSDTGTATWSALLFEG